MNTINIANEIDGSAVRFGFEKTWTPQRHQFAVHTDARFIEVSKQQFFDLIGNLDVVALAKTNRETKNSGSCSTFSLRNRTELGRIYSGNYNKDVEIEASYFLEMNFANSKKQLLENSYQKIKEVQDESKSDYPRERNS